MKKIIALWLLNEKVYGYCIWGVFAEQPLALEKKSNTSTGKEFSSVKVNAKTNV